MIMIIIYNLIIMRFYWQLLHALPHAKHVKLDRGVARFYLKIN